VTYVPGLEKYVFTASRDGADAFGCDELPEGLWCQESASSTGPGCRSAFANERHHDPVPVPVSVR
jgi:hypothetical protein